MQFRQDERDFQDFLISIALVFNPVNPVYCLCISSLCPLFVNSVLKTLLSSLVF